MTTNAGKIRRIRLTKDLPIHHKYGMTKGRVFNPFRDAPPEPGNPMTMPGVWVKSDGMPIKLYVGEYEVLWIDP